MLVNTEYIVTSDKFKHSDDVFKFFIGYQEDEIVQPLWIILPQMSGYIKCFETVAKTCIFWLKMTMYWINTTKFWMWLKIN